MTATNDLLTFGDGTGANVLAQADYASLAARTAGFTAGTALSAQLNKVWRQAAFVAAMIGQFTADHSGQNTVDNGDVATFEANFATAVQAITGGVLPANAEGSLHNNGSGTLSWVATSASFLNAGTFGGSANALTAICKPTALTPPYAGTIMVGTIASTNTSTTVTIAADSNAAKTVYLSDGATVPPVGSLIAGHLILFEFDGSSHFRALMDLTTGGPVGSGTAYLPLTGGILSGNVTQSLASGDANYILNKTSGHFAALYGQTGGSDDWGVILSDGSGNFQIQRFSGGSFIENVLSIDHTNGLVTFSHGPAAPGAQFTNTVFVTTGAADAAIALDRNATHGAYIVGRTGGLNRWQWVLGDGSPETGSSAGSIAYLARYDDSGNYIDSVLSVTRNLGVVNFSQQPTWAGSKLLTAVSVGAGLTGNGTPGSPLNTSGKQIVAAYDSSGNTFGFASISNGTSGGGSTTSATFSSALATNAYEVIFVPAITGSVGVANANAISKTTSGFTIITTAYGAADNGAGGAASPPSTCFSACFVLI